MATNVSRVVTNLARVRQRIAAAARQAGRPVNAVTLLAVSKTKPVAAILAAYEAGQRSFGENYLQEALDKQRQLAELDIEWHFIGPLQANKSRPAAERFDWVHSVDRLKVAQRLDRQRPAELPPLNVCLQVNIDAEPSKTGLRPEELPALAADILAMPRLRLRGLMAIPRPSDCEQQQRRSFAALAALLRQLQTQHPDCHHLDTLSMGMSGDMNAAIAEGSTLVRIGTDLFGARDYPNKETT